ncbi:iron-containing alcohol dehydrogenase [bacterium]|nr:iron-containing alcohol dehydrogenase [bacterium]
MAGFALRSANEVVFGSGSRKQAGRLAAALGQRALLVTGRGAARRGLVDDFRGILAGAGLQVAVFDAVEPEPSLQTVDAGREALRAHGADVVVAVGGGSAMDVGKAIGALALHERGVEHYFTGGHEITGSAVPVIALPTTSGTGAEVTPNSVLSDPDTLHKASIRGLALMPRVAIVDPELTLGLPAQQTAFSGLDALVQAIESHTSTGVNLVSDMYAEEGTVRLAGSLRRAVEDGSDLAAREDMALGSLLAGLALASARLGLVHGLAHPLGVMCHLPHGRVCGWLMPTVMRFNMEAARERYAHLAGRIGLEPTAEAFVAWFGQLAADLGACGSWREAGLTESAFERLVPVVVSAGSSRFNPRPLTDEGVREVLETLLGA